MYCIFGEPVDQVIGNVAGPNAVRPSRVIGSLVDEMHEAELGRAEESLELWGVHDVALEIIKRNLAPDVILELVDVGEYALPLLVGHFDSPSSALFCVHESHTGRDPHIIRLSRYLDRARPSRQRGCGTVSRPCHPARPEASLFFSTHHQAIGVSGRSTD